MEVQDNSARQGEEASKKTVQKKKQWELKWWVVEAERVVQADRGWEL